MSADNEKYATPVPRPYWRDYPADQKVSPGLAFEGGSLSIKGQGFGDQDGSGEFTFKDEDLEWGHGEDEGYRSIRLGKSELAAIRQAIAACHGPYFNDAVEPPTWRPGLPPDGAEGSILGRAADGSLHILRWAKQHSCFVAIGWLTDRIPSPMPLVTILRDAGASFIVEHAAEGRWSPEAGTEGEREDWKARYEELWAKSATDEMAAGALDAIQTLLDSGEVPRGTFPDDQVRNLVALYNGAKSDLAEISARAAAEHRELLHLRKVSKIARVMTRGLSLAVVTDFAREHRGASGPELHRSAARTRDLIRSLDAADRARAGQSNG